MRTIKQSVYYGISIILPALNEEKNIRRAVSEALTYIDSVPLGGEVIVINDGSTDTTAEIVSKISEEDTRVTLINHEKNQGYGASFRDAIKVARFDMIFFTDADRQFNIKGLDIMLPLMNTGVIDIIVGYRMDRQDTFFRKFLSWGFNTLVGFMFDLQIKDIDCAFKLFRREVFSKLEVESNNFFINTEVLAKARRLGFVILEVGVKHFPRTAGKSTVSFKYIPITIRELTKIWLKLSRMKKGRT